MSRIVLRGPLSSLRLGLSEFLLNFKLFLGNDLGFLLLFYSPKLWLRRLLPFHQIVIDVQVWIGFTLYICARRKIAESMINASNSPAHCYISEERKHWLLYQL